MQYLLWLDIILSLLITLVVMLQSKGSGLSIIAWTGDFWKFERRGPERVLHYFTIALVALFVVTSLLIYFIS